MGESFQRRVAPWMQVCFGPEISADCVERRHRFLEESLELLQSIGGTKHEALQLVDYVFGRDKGEPHQEVGGVMITLAALCLAAGLDMHKAGEDELARIWTKVDAIRAKQAAKPRHSVLPIAQSPASP
jgi:NTP pyrophosphatase (non-canonical NTP hydrolase)